MSFCKKLLCVAVFLGFTMTCGALSVLAESTAVISADIVNVRAEASTNSTIIERVTEGQLLKVMSLDGEWFRVNTPASNNVYVNSQFITVLSAEATVNDDSVNIRSGASTSTDILGKLNKGNNINVTSMIGDFYEFSYNGRKAYIHKDFVVGSFINYIEKKAAPKSSPAPAVASQSQPAVPAQVVSYPVVSNDPRKETVYALVMSTTGVNLRQQPDQSSAITTVLSYGEAADILEVGSQWHKVSYNGIEGYVSAEFSVVKTGIKPDNSIRTAIVNYAKQSLGTPYVWGGTSLKSGVDCSGFTYSVFKHFGVTLSRTSSAQIRNGTKVKKSELLPGDLVFFDTNGSNNGAISHVGIYIGNGSFIHASSSRSSYCVTISSLSEYYYSKAYVSACRLL